MAGMEEDFENVPALRTDGQGPPDGPQGEPLEHQDQAALPAEPRQRHLHLGRARPQRAPARLDQRAEERRPQWRPRQVPAEGEGRRVVAARTGFEARDREEGRQARVREEGELRFLGKHRRIEFEAAGSNDPAVFVCGDTQECLRRFVTQSSPEKLNASNDCFN